jgi:hypothetical protein
VRRAHQNQDQKKKKKEKKEKEKEKEKEKKKENYNSRDSLVVTHPTVNLPAYGSCAVSSRVGAARVRNV